MAIQLQVGGEYRTRNGGWVRIYEFTHGYSHPYRGEYSTRRGIPDMQMRWRGDGFYFGPERETAVDIVSEVFPVTDLIRLPHEPVSGAQLAEVFIEFSAAGI